ncbi:MAG: NADH-ubiquinone/plastoquinone oxidoreductase chain family protein [Hyphomicrobiales bacterium]|nr:NADH-ubiquinone/plastoquinone oxidoreductase chain family protein [Hyphomicrobiales bacterium]
MIASALSSANLFGLCGASLAGFGLFIVIIHASLLRRIVGFNLLGAGIFLVFGAIARRGAAAGFDGDPVPQAMVITGIVVAFSATALSVALLLRLFGLTGRAAFDAPPADASRQDET